MSPLALKAGDKDRLKVLEKIQLIPYFESDSFLPGFGGILQIKPEHEALFYEIDFGISKISLDAGLKTTVSCCKKFDEGRKNFSLGFGIYDLKILSKDQKSVTLIVPVAYGYQAENGTYFKVGANGFMKDSALLAHPFVRVGHVF
jgi:hypothetical protein